MAQPMSTTMPFASSFSDMKATATVKVAPCSACAGPKTSPLNEWAIMMWSETSTAYTDAPSVWIADELAQHAARGREDAGQFRGQIVEGHRRGNQLVEHRIFQQIERSGQTAAIVPAQPVTGRHLADLAGDQPQPPRMEDVAERHCYVICAVPGELQHRRLLAGEPQRGRKACARRTGVHHEVAVVRRLVRGGESRAEGSRDPGATRINVDHRYLPPGNLRPKAGDKQPEHARAQPPDPGPPCLTALGSASILAASPARSAGNPSGSGTIFCAGRLNTVWCG